MTGQGESSVQNVITQTNPAQIEDPALAFVRDYWNARRGGRAMPSRADIRPADMKKHLGWIVMLDVLNGGDDFRYRTLGTRITEHFGSDPTGRTIKDFYSGFGAGVRDVALEVMRQAVEERAPVLTTGVGGTVGYPFIKFGTIYAPLSDDGAHVNILMGAMRFEYLQGRV